jgi:hypothetical protein
MARVLVVDDNVDILTPVQGVALRMGLVTERLHRRLSEVSGLSQVFDPEKPMEIARTASRPSAIHEGFSRLGHKSACAWTGRAASPCPQADADAGGLCSTPNASMPPVATQVCAAPVTGRR